MGHPRYKNELFQRIASALSAVCGWMAMLCFIPLWLVYKSKSLLGCDVALKCPHVSITW
jgi:hypothetical protein